MTAVLTDGADDGAESPGQGLRELGLRIDGVPVGRVLGERQGARRRLAGSCIAVVATDAPPSPAQLERVARRADLGLARTGSAAHHGSDEIVLAFATGQAAATAARGEASAAGAGAAEGSAGASATDASAATARAGAASAAVADAALDAVLAATVEGTEAVVNALWCVREVIGRDGRTVHALQHDDVLELLAAHHRRER